ncbi:MAG: hypothetical protein PUE75_00645 [Eubacteriales bacterium]|nr:hypothetical protein [Eubacteriales bacterium]
MTENEKRLVRYAVVIPVIVAVLLSVVVCTALAKGYHPFTEAQLRLADYQAEDIKQPSGYEGSAGETASRQDIASCITDNTIIGDISIGNSNYPVIYNANEVNASGKFNIKNDVLIGETGVSFAEIYKNDSNMVKMLSKGDVITVTTFYSVYEFEVTETLTVSNNSQLSNCGEGIGSAIVLYTDNSTGPGISNERFVCVCKMISGSKVRQSTGG